MRLSAKTQPTASRWIKPFHFPYLRPPPLNSSTHPKGAWVEVKRSRLALSRNITLTGAPLKHWHVNIMYLCDSNLQNTFSPASDVYPSVFCQFSSFLNLDLQYLRTGSSIWNVALRTDRTPFPYGFQWKKKNLHPISPASICARAENVIPVVKLDSEVSGSTPYCACALSHMAVHFSILWCGRKLHIKELCSYAASLLET